MANSNDVIKLKRISRTRQIIFFILGIIEALLGFRFLFKLLGANPLSPFVTFIYSITDILVAPFFDIFRQVIRERNGVVAVLEPATIVAMLVYAFFAWGLVRLIDIFTNNHLNEGNLK